MNDYFSKGIFRKPNYFNSCAARLTAIVLVLTTALFLMTSVAADEHKTPIKVLTDEMEPVTFSRMIYKPMKENSIELAPAEFDIAIMEEMRRWGHNVVGAENLVFNIDKSHQATKVLGGTIKTIKCDQTNKANYELCDIAIEWEVLDRVIEKVVYRTGTRSFMLREVRHSFDNKDVHKLVKSALLSLLSRPNFVKTLKRGGKTSTSGVAVNTIGKFRQCSNKPARLPAGMEKVLNSTVIVKSDGRIGSGLIISKDGYILTANHVVESVNEVELVFHNGRKGKASVIRKDPTQDVALLESKTKVNSCLPVSYNLPPTGAELYIIGAPLNEQLSFSVSKGIVSGIRQIEGSQFIQTDASLNPGNSGGPVLDGRGRVVGIVSWKVVAQGFEGLGFGTPVPIALARLAITPGSASNISIVASPNADSKESKLPLVDKYDRLPDQICVERTGCFTTIRLTNHAKKKRK